MLVASREKEREMRWWRPGASAMGVHFLRNKKGESGNHSSSENQTQCARNNPQKVPLWPYHPHERLHPWPAWQPRAPKCVVLNVAQTVTGLLERPPIGQSLEGDQRRLARQPMVPFFWPCRKAQDLNSLTRMEPMPPALEAQSLNHCTFGEVPCDSF